VNDGALKHVEAPQFFKKSVEAAETDEIIVSSRLEVTLLAASNDSK
jgi:hypothetical protein